VPLFHYDDIFQGLPFDCVPVAVDLIEGAVPLPAFQHSDRMFYIFGPEDGTLGKAITTKCKYVVQIPSRHCLNLAAAVNIILYDRNTKRRQLCMKSQAAACNIGINEVCTEALNA
jgi:tRNA C32,U32 (ribose-2'-O)-methylase TrmJ